MNKLKKQHIPAIPDDFLEALNYFPETSGVAMGVDRLAMFLQIALILEMCFYFRFANIFRTQWSKDGLAKKDR